MMRRVIWLFVVALVGLIAVYLSRFWVWSLWGRDGLFGLPDLRPGGALLQRWLRGTDFAPFELLIWAVAGFLVLTLLQRLYDALAPKSDPHDDDTT